MSMRCLSLLERWSQPFSAYSPRRPTCFCLTEDSHGVNHHKPLCQPYAYAERGCRWALPALSYLPPHGGHSRRCHHGLGGGADRPCRQRAILGRADCATLTARPSSNRANPDLMQFGEGDALSAECACLDFKSNVNNGIEAPGRLRWSGNQVEHSGAIAWRVHRS
jgi:hypothetical protein